MGRIKNHVALVAAKTRWWCLISRGSVGPHGEACIVHFINNDIVVLLNIAGNPVLEDVLPAGTLDQALPVRKVFEDVPNILPLLHLSRNIEGQRDQLGNPTEICNNLTKPTSTLLKLGEQELFMECRCMLP
jgi:hypothetical protein